MSFASDVKEEIGKQYDKGRHCQIAQLAVIFALTGHIKRDFKNENYIEMRTENLTVAKKSYMLLKCMFDISPEVMIRTHNLMARSKNYFICIKDSENVLEVLRTIKLLSDEDTWGDFNAVNQLIIRNTCCKRAFLRGAFMVAGSVTNPQKGYHLEIAVTSVSLAQQLKEAMSCFEIDAKIVERKKYQVVYIKEGAQIVDVLNVIGAHKALMEFENVRIVKEVRNFVNRQVNCETANISKIVNTAARQIEDIKYIQCNRGFSALTDGLKEIAELRLEYPDSSLQELGKMLDRPISKSGVNHRLKKLSNIANEIRQEKENMNL